MACCLITAQALKHWKPQPLIISAKMVYYWLVWLKKKRCPGWPDMHWSLSIILPWTTKHIGLPMMTMSHNTFQHKYLLFLKRKYTQKKLIIFLTGCCFKQGDYHSLSFQNNENEWELSSSIKDRIVHSNTQLSMASLQKHNFGASIFRSVLTENLYISSPIYEQIVFWSQIFSICSQNHSWI